MACPSDLHSRRVLVTGLEGFTGRHLACELRNAGYLVSGLSSDHDGAVTEPVDLLDAAAVHTAVSRIQPDAVIHLAAIAFVAHGDVESIYRTNIVGTRHLLAALAESPRPPSKVILASSANVYGNVVGNRGPLDEQTPLAPANDYAVSKVAMEYMARTWATHLPLVFVRPFNYTGIGQSDKFLIPKIVDHYRRGDKRIELGNLDVWREFMDVRALSWAYRRLLETSSDADVFNVCTGNSHSLRDVLAIMADIAGYTIEVSVNPAFARSNEVVRLEGNGARLQARVGELPSFTIEDTLRWMYHSTHYA